MPEYIKRETITWMLSFEGIPDDSIVGQAVRMIRETVERLPAEDVVEIAPDLREVVKILCEKYEKAKQTSFVRDPLAYALYQTWKSVEEKRGCRP